MHFIYSTQRISDVKTLDKIIKLLRYYAYSSSFRIAIREAWAHSLNNQIHNRDSLELIKKNIIVQKQLQSNQRPWYWNNDGILLISMIYLNFFFTIHKFIKFKFNCKHFHQLLNILIVLEAVYPNPTKLTATTKIWMIKRMKKGKRKKQNCVKQRHQNTSFVFALVTNRSKAQLHTDTIFMQLS